MFLELSFQSLGVEIKYMRVFYNLFAILMLASVVFEAQIIAIYIRQQQQQQPHSQPGAELANNHDHRALAVQKAQAYSLFASSHRRSA